MTEKKKKFLLENLLLETSVVDELIYLCDTLLGTDKYAVWIAKEYKKDSTILSYDKLRDIIDWAQSESPNILGMDYAKALKEAEIFHKSLKNKKVEKIKEKIDPKRIIYRCSDGKHFFYTLKSEDLKREGQIMGHCIGTNAMYAKKLKKGIIKVISLRDNKNMPHVTFEINMINGKSEQISGKKNDTPISKYLNFITEFGTWAAGDSFTEEERNELNRLMKLHNG